MNDREQQLAHLIEQRSSQGEIGWEATAHPDRFLAPFRGVSVQTEMDENEVALCIVNDKGQVIERIALPSRALNVAGKDREAHRALVNIFHAARRQAMRVDEAIESLLEQLQK